MQMHFRLDGINGAPSAEILGPDPTFTSCGPSTDLSTQAPQFYLDTGSANGNKPGAPYLILSIEPFTGPKTYSLGTYFTAAHVGSYAGSNVPAFTHDPAGFFNTSGTVQISSVPGGTAGHVDVMLGDGMALLRQTQDITPAGHLVGDWQCPNP